jgi:hypothetical protein
MRQLARALLKLATLAIPVVIAACYGVQYAFSKSGKVIDKSTHAGINGIKVSCVLADGTVESECYSDSEGSFVLMFDNACSKVTAEDVDGTENGKYSRAEIAYSEESSVLLLEMEPETVPQGK